MQPVWPGSRPLSARARALLADAGVVAFFALLVGGICAPFLLRPAEVIPGSAVFGESYLMTWSVWWVHHSLFQEHVFPLWTDLLLFPRGGTFFSQMTVNALVLLPLAPLQLASTVLLNLSLFVVMVLGGVFSFKLLHHLVPDRAAALLGSVVYVACPLQTSFFRSGYLHGTNMAFLPLAWYLYLRMYEQPSAWRAFLAAASLALLLLGNPYYAIAALLLASLHFLWNASTLVRERDLERARGLGLAVLFSALWCLPVAYWISYTMRVSPLINSARSGVNSEAFIQFSNPDLLRFFLPLGRADYCHAPECCYLGLVPLALACFGFLARRFASRQAFYGMVVLVTVILGLGPYLVIDSQLVVADNHLIRLPFYYLYKYLPWFEVVRHPTRLMCVTYLCLAVLVAESFRCIRLEGRARVGAAGALGAMLLFEYLFIAPVIFPVPVLAATPPDYCRYLEEQQGHFGVVPLPYLGMFVQDAVYKHHQTFHRHGINAAFDRNDPPELDEVHFLQALKRFHLYRVPFDATGLDCTGDVDRLAALGYRYVIVHEAWLDRGDHVTVDLLRRLLGPPMAFRDGLLFVIPPPRDGSAVRQAK